MHLLSSKENKTDERSSSKINVFCFLLLSVISSLAIYASDTTLSSGQTQSILIAFVYVLSIVAAMHLLFSGSYKFSIILVSPIIFVFVSYFDSDSHSLNALLLLELLLFTSLQDSDKVSIYALYKKYIFITSIFGIIAYTSFIVGLPIPYDVKPYYSELTSSVYIDYHFSYLVNNFSSIRLCGLFNEPGYLGTLIGLILCVENLNFKKKENLMFLFAGILTFSVAFFFIIALRALFMAFTQKGAIFKIITVVVVLLIILKNVDLGSSMNRLIERFTFSDGKFVGDNRTKEIVDETLDGMLESSYIWWGYGNGYGAQLTTAISTYKTRLIDFGIIGFSMIYGSLIISTMINYSYKNRNVIFFVICYVASVYQRPNIFTLPYFVIFLGGIAFIEKRDNLIN